MSDPSGPEQCTCTVYQNSLAAPARDKAKNDLYISGSKIVVLADKNAASKSAAGSNEFSFEAVHGADVMPQNVASSVLPELVHTVLRGINALLLVFGPTASGKNELVEGMDSGSSSGWEGMAERMINSLYASLQADSSTPYTLRMQFLNITEERVQDLLQPGCHAHDLELHEDAAEGIRVRDAELLELKSKAQAVGLYRRGCDAFHSLERYHGVDAAAACTLLSVSLTQVARPGADTTDCKMSTFSLVTLPGSERLVEERSSMQLTDGIMKHRSLIQYAELVRALSRRRGAEHVPWRGGKLTQLLGEKLGNNGRVHCIATVKSGQRNQTLATLRYASDLRKVMCYPVVNLGSARGLLALRRSELIALRHDMEAMQLRGMPTPARAVLEEPPQPQPQPLVQQQTSPQPAPTLNTAATATAPPSVAFEDEQRPGQPPQTAQSAATEPAAAAEGAQRPTIVVPPTVAESSSTPAPPPPVASAVASSPSPAAGDTAGHRRLAQSKLEGQLLQGELEQQRLKEQRLQAVRDKRELQEKYEKLLGEKQVLERQNLEAEEERLRVAKALVELKLDEKAASAQFDEEVKEMKREVQQLKKQKSKGEADRERILKDLKQRDADLRVAGSERDDLVQELIAVRMSLDRQREQHATDEGKSRQLACEVVESVNQAEAKAAQLKEQRAALDASRAEVEELQVQLYAEKRRAEGLAIEMDNAKLNSSSSTARIEELELELKRAAVQKQLRDVSLAKERGEKEEIDHQHQLAASQARGTTRAAASERDSVRQHEHEENARLLQEVRAELTSAVAANSESSVRIRELETHLVEAEEREQASHAEFRSLLERQLQHASQLAAADADGGVVAPKSEMPRSEMSLDAAVSAIHVTLLEDAKRYESQLISQISSLRDRYAAESARRTVFAQPAAASDAAIAAAEDEAALQEARSEASTLRAERASLRIELEDASNTYSNASRAIQLERRQLKEELNRATAQASTDQLMQQMQRVGNGAVAESALQEELLKLAVQKGELQKQLTAKEHENHKAKQQAHDEMQKLRLENEKLRLQVKSGGTTTRSSPLQQKGGDGAGRDSVSMSLKIRELSSNLSKLEAERSNLKRRATSAEEQLEALQS